jgi:putative ABC transport system permease protein
MSNQNYTPQPPKWADRLLEWLYAPDALEEIQGDLQEIYVHRVKNAGEETAGRRYFLDMLGFIWSYGLKRRKHLQDSSINHPPLNFMFSHYVLTALRQLGRQPAISLSYVTGLTLGIASSLIIFLIIKQENSYDKHHPYSSRIYRVENHKIQEGFTTPGTPSGIVASLQEFTDIEKVVPVKMHHRHTITAGQGNATAKYRESVAFADKSIVELLQYQWLEGSPSTALAQPGNVVITESYARKFFGEARNVTGKSIRIDNKLDLLVSGVIADYKVSTDFAFNIIASYPTLKSLNPDYNFNEWTYFDDNHQTFVLLKPEVNPAQVEALFAALVQRNFDTQTAKQIGFTLLPLSKLHFSSNFGARAADEKLLEALTLVGIFILFLACINFINLATARGTKRAKEVGVRKVLGSNRTQLIYQFLSEAAVISSISLIFSIGLAYVILPFVSQLLGVFIGVSTLLSIQTFIFLGIILVLVSLLAGFYPAVVLSGFSPVKAIKNEVNSKNSGKVLLRNTLVVFQLGISLILIISAIIVSSQLRLFQEANLGFTKETMLTVEIPDNNPSKLEVLRQKLLQSPQIRQASYSWNSASAESNWMDGVEYLQGEVKESIRTQMKWADEYFLDAYNIQLVAGEGLGSGDSLTKVLVNEIFAGRMNLKSPREAVGKMVMLDGKALPIAGVVKNFHVNSLHQKIDPTLIAIRPRFFSQINISLAHPGLNAAAIKKSLKHIEQSWTEAYPENVFSYAFLDQTLAEAYRKETITATLISIATSMAIIISCLGLFGLAVFTTQQRVKEIGIRKVLGASTSSILLLVSKDSLKLVLLANTFAWPLAWWYMSKWLQNFEFRIAISPWVFILAALAACMLTLVTISYQSVKAALANPVSSLRNN